VRVYVATKWSRRLDAWKVMNALRARGHEITHDWTVEEDPGQNTTPEARREFYGLCAAADVDGVLSADALVLLHDPGCRGAFVELGIALAHGVRVIVVDGDGHPEHTVPLFYFLPEVRHVASIEEAIGLVGELAEAS
jgi:hypothetical protein